MIIVLTGAPGAGKGTQADLLAQRDGYLKVSTGDALRKHIKSGTPIGKIADGIMAKGQLVPDDVLLKILETELAGTESQVVLLDGYPRNLAQAQELEKTLARYPVAGAIQLDVDRDDLISRISGRIVCAQCQTPYHATMNPPKKSGVCDKCGSTQLVRRPDDAPDKVATRLDVYDKNTKPVLDFYRAKGVCKTIDGARSTEEVYKDLKATIQDLSRSRAQ